MDDAVNQKPDWRVRLDRHVTSGIFPLIREDVRACLSALDAANERLAEQSSRLDTRAMRITDLEAQLALAAPLLEAGYAYRTALNAYAAGAGAQFSLLAIDAKRELLRVAEALPPRDGGQAVG